MKSLILLIQTTKKRLRLRRGETLVEAIVSILLLAILLGTVTAMIQVSLNLTARALEEARELQNDTFNPAIFGTHDDFDLGVVSLEVITGLETITGFIETEHEIEVLEISEDIVSFIPVPDQFKD